MQFKLSSKLKKNQVINVYILFLTLISTFASSWQHNLDRKERAASSFKAPKLPTINESTGEKRHVLYHKQTVAIIDVTDKNYLINCEVIET